MGRRYAISDLELHRLAPLVFHVTVAETMFPGETLTMLYFGTICRRTSLRLVLFQSYHKVSFYDLTLPKVGLVTRFILCLVGENDLQVHAALRGSLTTVSLSHNSERFGATAVAQTLELQQDWNWTCAGMTRNCITLSSH